MSWYAIVGARSGELLTYRGQLLIHDDRAELEFLIPNQRVVPVGGHTPEEVSSRYDRPVLRWRDHPDMAAVRWPLRKEAFL